MSEVFERGIANTLTLLMEEVADPADTRYMILSLSEMRALSVARDAMAEKAREREGVESEAHLEGGQI